MLSLARQVRRQGVDPRIYLIINRCRDGNQPIQANETNCMTADSPLPAMAPGSKYSNGKIRVMVLLLAFLAVLAYMIEGILVENSFMTDRMRMRMGMVTANLHGDAHGTGPGPFL